jgi:prepilin peptidase CpaA
MMINDGFTLAMMGLLAATLVWIAIVDIRKFTISNWINLGIAAAAPLFWLVSGVAFWPDGAIRAGVALIVFLLFAIAFYLNAMGGGDVKLAAALALWFTPFETAKLIVLTSIAGGLLTLIVLGVHRVRRKESRPEVPYGVAIAFGGLWLLAQRFLNHFA